MKISVNQTKKGVFSVTLDDTVLTLDQVQMKKLLMEAVKALMPGALPTVDPKQLAKTLSEKLKRANPPGLQKLIMTAEEDDVLKFLKGSEDDTRLLDWFFQNMSNRKQTMYKEDMEFKFHDGVPDDDLTDAVNNLSDLANSLKNDGIMEFDG
ncbi:MAG: hypothetical protein KAR80_03245 [Rhodospirillaceae bacterium]|nr:hypothetical protein [Rhodospirillaceae bacterium]MCK5166513.1 hypothetical protein [Rhodospirillaceae bacterium]